MLVTVPTGAPVAPGSVYIWTGYGPSNPNVFSAPYAFNINPPPVYYQISGTVTASGGVAVPWVTLSLTQNGSAYGTAYSQPPYGAYSFGAQNGALSENLTERPLLRSFLHPLNREELDVGHRHPLGLQQQIPQASWRLTAQRSVNTAA